MIRLALVLYVKYPLSLGNVEDLLAELGIDIPATGRAVGHLAIYRSTR